MTSMPGATESPRTAALSTVTALRTIDELCDLRTVLESAEPAPGLPVSLLRGLKNLLRCDAVSFNAMDSTRRSHRFQQGVVGDQVEQIESEGPDGSDAEPFWTHYWSSMCCSYPDRSGDLVSVTRISDFLSRREYRSSPMYADYLGAAGVEHELMLVLPDGGPGRTLRLLFSRGEGPDFDERDRFLLQLLRPHVQTAYQRAQARRNGAGGLTARQRDVLALVRDGATNTAIARRLGISEGTVRTHLQNIYVSLGVSSRTSAVVAAGDLL